MTDIIGLYIDSLRLQNLKLNKRLNSFITALDEQVQAAFQNRETRIAEAKALSFKLFAATIIVAIVLLISYPILSYRGTYGART